MSSFSRFKLETELKEAGIKLLALSSSITTQVQELLDILDQVDALLSKVEQGPSRSMQDALYPSMKALISDQLLKHSDIDVKVSLASCMSELTRITAPDAPYDDVQMKEIFQLIVMALGMLSSEATRGSSKALHILDNIAKIRACLLMLDLECERLIADMFKQFLSTIRYIPLPVVFEQMVYIMTLTLEESEEIPDELLSILLSSVSKKKENQTVLSRSWRLGEKVLRNCAVELQRFLPKVVRSRNLNFNDYSNIVASICQNSPEGENEVAEEADPSAIQPSETIMDDGIGLKRTNGTLQEENSLETLEHCHEIKQQENTEAGRHSQPENSDVTGTVQAKAVTVPKKRGRKPSSLQKPEVGRHNFMTGERRETFEEPRYMKNYDKKIGSSASEQSALGQEDRATNFATSRPLHIDSTNSSGSQHVSHTDGSQPTKLRQKSNSTVVNWCHEVAAKTNARTNHAPASIDIKKEGDDSEEYFEKVSRMPHGINVFGEKLVGRSVKVWWPLDEMFYEGAIASFDSLTQMHKVLYADGDEETLNLRNERWELLEEPNIERHAEFSSPAAASHKSLKKKKKAKTKSASSAKQQGTISSSNWHGEKSKTEAPKSGSSVDNFAPDAVCIADLKKDNVSEVDPTFKQKSTSEANDSKPGVEVGGVSAIHTTFTENDKPGCENLSEDIEMGILADSVDAQGSDSSSVTKRRRLVNSKGVSPLHGSLP